MNLLTKFFINTLSKNKRIQYAGLSAVFTMLFFIVILLLNLIVSQLDISFDLSEDRRYSISHEGKRVLSGLDKDVTIYALYVIGQPIEKQMQFLRNFTAQSQQITLKVLDPDKNPWLSERFETEDGSLPANAVIVEHGSSYKVLSPDDFYEIYPDVRIYNFTIEDELIKAIINVTADRFYTVYQLKGHDEYDLVKAKIAEEIAFENFLVKDLVINSVANIEYTDTIITIISPKQDLSVNEKEFILEYVDNGGKLLVILPYSDDDFPVLDSIVSRYNIELGSGLTFEGDANHYVRNPWNLLPLFTDHAINTYINQAGYAINFNRTRPIFITSERSGYEASVIAHTTDTAWIRDDIENTGERSPRLREEKTQQITIAAAVEDKNADIYANSMRMVVLGSIDILLPEQVHSMDNVEYDERGLKFFTDSLVWLVSRHERQSDLYFPPKDLKRQKIILSDTMKSFFNILFAGVFPLLIFATGFIVWLRRRHK